MSRVIVRSIGVSIDDLAARSYAYAYTEHAGTVHAMHVLLMKRISGAAR